MNLNRSLVFGLLLLLGAAPAAHAGEITIDFDLRASTVSVLNGLIQVPPDGSFPAASAIVRVPGDGISTPLSGPATLKSWVWSFTFSAPVQVYGFAVTLKGHASGQQTGEVVGSLTAGLGSFVFDEELRGNFAAKIECTPATACALPCALGYCFPISPSGVISTPSGTFGLGNLSQKDQATLTATTSYPGYFTMGVVGSEVHRSFAPEPSGALLSLGGIAAVVGLSLCRRLRERGRC